MMPQSPSTPSIPRVLLQAEPFGTAGSFLDPPPPAALPGPPAFDRYLLESPLLAMAVLLGAGFAAYWFLRSRGKAGAGAAVGVGLAMMAAGVFLAARMVETPREAMGRAAKALVAAVAGADLAAADGLLSPEAALYSFLSPAGMPKAEILSVVERDFAPGRGRYALKEWAVLERQAVLDTPVSGRVHIKVRVTPDATAFPNLSWWRLDFERGGDGRWRVRGIQPLSIAGQGNASGR